MSTTENRYAPPVAPVADVDQQHDDDETPFFAVSTLKLVLMIAFTFGIYQVYWFYKNWKRVREREGSSIWPFWRAFFMIIWVYPLFMRIRAAGEERGVQSAFAAGPLAIAFIILSLVINIPGPFALVGVFTIVINSAAQRYVNEINTIAVPGHDRNANFTGWNWLGLAFGGLFLVLAIVGALMSTVTGIEP